MKYAIENIDLIYKYASESDIIEKFIFDNFGLKGGKLLINERKEVQVIITESSGIDVLAKMWIPFETVVTHVKSFNILTVKAKDKSDLILFSINICDLPDSLLYIIDQDFIE